MNFKRLFYTEQGKVFISILLGLGLASLFRSACKNRKCIVFRQPLCDACLSPMLNAHKSKLYFIFRFF